METDVNLIRQNASKWAQQLDQLSYDETQRELFFKLFMSWLANSMPDVPEKELRKMTSLARNITHTRFYKDVTERSRREGRRKGRQGGRLEGIKEGMHKGETKGRLKLLREMLDEGEIAQAYFDKKVKDLPEQGLISSVSST